MKATKQNAREQDDAEWNRQVEKDAASGKLDFLFKEAEQERAAGQLRDWPDKDAN